MMSALERITLYVAVRLIRAGDRLQRIAYQGVVRRTSDEV